jgi:O-antigen/teichoic acid export membrane protein
VLASAYSLIFRGCERMDCSAGVDVANRALLVAVSVPALLLGGHVLAAILAQGVAGVGALGVAALLFRRLHLGQGTVSRQTARALVAGGAPVVAMSLAIALQPNVDAILLSKLAPATAVGWFAAARNFMGVLIAPASILGSASYPRLSRARNSPAQFRHELRTALRPLLVLGALGTVGTYLFAELAVGLVYGTQKFGPSVSILQVFAPGLLLLFIDMQLGGAILASGRSIGLAVAKATAVLIGAGLDWLLIPWCQARFGNGGIGVVLSFSLSEFVIIVAALLLIPRGTLDRRSVMDVGRAVAAGALTLVVCWSLPAMSPFALLPVCIVVFSGICVAVRLVEWKDVLTFRALLVRDRRGV